MFVSVEDKHDELEEEETERGLLFLLLSFLLDTLHLISSNTCFTAP
jgi:hypothetical protein